LARSDDGVRRCACPCKKPLTGRSERTRYWSPRCRQRVYRARLAKAAEAVGVPARLSLESLQATTGTGKRHGDAQRRARRRNGASIYLKRPELLDVAVDALDHTRDALERVNDPAADDLAEVATAVRRAIARHQQRSER
jgi:hypothetical protein